MYRRFSRLELATKLIAAQEKLLHELSRPPLVYARDFNALGTVVQELNNRLLEMDSKLTELKKDVIDG